MTRTSFWAAGLALLVGAAARAGQDLPPLAALPAPPATAPGHREPYPPPLPAVVDPRTGAWRQVYVPPGACAETEWVRVGMPCPRCGEKFLHPLRGHRRADGRPCEGPAAPAEQVGAELLPPALPAGAAAPR